MKRFLKSLLGAVVGGAATAAMDAVSTGVVDPKQLGKMAVIGGLVSVVAYLKKPPTDDARDLLK